MAPHEPILNEKDRAPIAPLMTVRGVTTVLGISKGTLYRMISRGDLAPIRVSQSPRFRPTDVEAFIERNRVRSEHKDAQ